MKAVIHIFSDHTRSLAFLAPSDFDVSAWAQSRKDSFALLGITGITEQLLDVSDAAPTSRLFDELPLGARFRYETGGPVFVKLAHEECGRVIRWEGANKSHANPVCSFEDSPEARAARKVQSAD